MPKKIKPSVRAHLDVITHNMEWLMDLTDSKCMVLLDIDSLDIIEGSIKIEGDKTIFVNPLIVVNRDDDES